MNKKLNVILEAPVLNRSGYGVWADDIFHALIKNENLDIKVVPTNWGSCVSKVCKSDADKVIIDHFPKQPITSPPDLYICQTLPHMSAQKGKLNVNITAGIEVDKAYPQIIDGINKNNLTIVCSEFAKQVFLNSDTKPITPIEVCHWGADTRTFRPDAPAVETVEKELGKIGEDECFLFVGQNTHPRPFCDRKDMDSLIKTFCELFRNREKKPALILKTSGTDFSNFDRNAMLEKIKLIKSLVAGELPNIYLLHGELSDKEMAALYSHKKVIAHISFSHGEGFGAPLLQGVLSGKPTFASGWSAHTEFITDKLFLFEGSVNPIPPQIVSEFFMQGSKWFTVDYAKAGAKLLDFYDSNREVYNKAAKELATKCSKDFSLFKMKTNLHDILKRHFNIEYK